MKYYQAYFIWPTEDEPLCIGKNKERTRQRAFKKAKRIYGTGYVDRPLAMCSAKIQKNDIGIEEIEFVQQNF